jgi:hypothetical protein
MGNTFRHLAGGVDAVEGVFGDGGASGQIQPQFLAGEMSDHPPSEIAATDDRLWFFLGGVQKSLQSIERTLAEDRLAAAQYRTDIRKEIKNVSDQTLTVHGELRLTAIAVDDIRPKVEELWQHRQRSVGAGRLWSSFGQLAHIFSAALGGVIAVLTSHWFFHGKP